MKILKRNQIIISVLALMLITVGYMSYTSNINNTLETGALMNSETMANIGDAKLVNSNDIVENDNVENIETSNSEIIQQIQQKQLKVQQIVIQVKAKAQRQQVAHQQKRRMKQIQVRLLQQLKQHQQLYMIQTILWHLN